ncbi:MAG: hypothetical protein AAF682_14905 [Planctomycetota bacterium]
MKTLFKLLLASGACVGAAAALLGTSRVTAFAGQVRRDLAELVDRGIDDQAALRLQVAELRESYPRELDRFRAELAAVEDELAALAHEHTVAQRVVELARRDRDDLHAQMALAADTVRSGSLERRLPFLPSDEELTQRLVTAESTAAAYASRGAEIELQVELLGAQRDRIAALLVEREEEYTRFLSQAAALETEVAVLERNERLIDWMREREQALADHAKYEATNLEGLLGDLARLRDEQGAELRALARGAAERDYEERARREVLWNGVASAAATGR